MRNIRISILILLPLLMFFVSCNKEQVQKQSEDKMNEKKEVLSEKKPVENKETNVSQSSNIKLYTIESVEKSKGKKVVPNLKWSENGKKMSTDDLKGNVLLINMWATWCGPCIKEMPALSAISEELKDKNFKMFGLNIFQNNSSKKVEDFLKTNPVSYTVLDGNQEVVNAFAETDGKTIDAVPTTFIVDKKGNIVETIIGARDKDTFLKLINKYIN